MATTTTIQLDLPDEAATVRLAVALAAVARSGDVFALDGDLGTGKTVFARAFINARAGQNEDEEVPSPTFTLLQSYELENGAVHHFDLYRLNAPDEALELGIEEAFSSGISLIEWPERLGEWLLPRDRLDVSLSYVGNPEARRATLGGHGDWPERLVACFI